MLKKLGCFAIMFVLASNVSLASASSPTEKIRGTVDAVLDTLRQGLSVEDRRGKIRGLLQQRFHFGAMSQRTLATNWKKATEEERHSFVELFSRMLEQTYIGKIEAYTDERVEYVNEKVKEKSAVVDTQIVTKSVTIPISYKVLKNGDDWMVYDVVVEKVSLISNYRSSYAEIVKKEGMSGLLVKMQEKIEQFENSTTAQTVNN